MGPLVVVAVHCLNYCLVLGMPLEADQPLIQTCVYHLSVRNNDLDYDSVREAEMINNADFQIMTDSDSCKETKISHCTSNQKPRIFLEIWCIKLLN
jgi:hypothetical protein